MSVRTDTLSRASKQMINGVVDYDASRQLNTPTGVNSRFSTEFNRWIMLQPTLLLCSTKS